MHFIYGLIVGFVSAAVVSFAYHAKVVNDYKKAASTVGWVFGKVEGKITAVRKGL